MITCRGEWRSDERPVGPAGAVVADGQEAGPSADVDAAATDRRHTVADQGRCAVARRAGAVRPWDRAYDLFRRWQRDGTWKQIFVQLQAEGDAKGLITWDVSVDSTIARAHQHAAGARKRGRAEGASRWR